MKQTTTNQTMRSCLLCKGKMVGSGFDLRFRWRVLLDLNPPTNATPIKSDETQLTKNNKRNSEIQNQKIKDGI
jgi:hypothetical protein